MTIFSDRDQVQQAIADGSWEIVWGDLINEFDFITFLVSLPTGTTAAWVAEQVEVQLYKFSQSLGEVSVDVLHQATSIVEDILQGKKLGKWYIDGLEIKGGIAAYHRWWQFGIGKYHLGGKKRLPNNYQPYIGLRVSKPLPSKGTSATPTPVHQSDLPTMKPLPDPILSQPKHQLPSLFNTISDRAGRYADKIKSLWTFSGHKRAANSGSEAHGQPQPEYAE